MNHSLSILVAEPGSTGDYALLDSGGGRKLERFGAVTVDRPEPQAMWQPKLPQSNWAKADGVFDGGDGDDDKGKWKHRGAAAEQWPMTIGGVTALCKFASFRHIGVFAEQAPHWTWMTEQLKSTPAPPRVLNLFGYTGLASLIAAKNGAEVTHVDASKTAVRWARDNQAESGLADAPIRWIVDDARKFAAREVRRAKTYHGLIVDPPKFGRGPEGEVWDLFEHLPALLTDCAKLIDPNNGFLVLTAYAIRASALAIDALAREVLAGLGGAFEAGELAIREQSAGRLLPTSLYVRWTRHG